MLKKVKIVKPTFLGNDSAMNQYPQAKEYPKAKGYSKPKNCLEMLEKTTF